MGRVVGADRGPWLTWIEIRADAHDPATATDFELMVRLRVDVDGSRFFERDWTERILRNRI